MRLLRRNVLRRMLRAHRYARKLQPCHKLADCALVQTHVEFSLDLTAQIHQPPAHHLVPLQIWTLPHPLRHLRFLLDGQLARWCAGILPVHQASEAQLVVAMHPVAQCLPIHAIECRRFATATPPQNSAGQTFRDPKFSDNLLDAGAAAGGP